MRDRIRKLLASRPLRITLLCLGTVLLLGIITAVTLNGIVVGSTKAQILSIEQAAALEDVDCVIVLGAGLRKDGTPSDMLRDRLAVGVSHYEAGLQAPYLMSGDNRTDDYNEVGAMQHWAVEHGMSDTVIFLDPYGLCTYDTHAHLARCITTEHRTVLNQDNLCTMTCSRNSRTNTSQTATTNNDISRQFDMLFHGRILLGFHLRQAGKWHQPNEHSHYDLKNCFHIIFGFNLFFLQRTSSPVQIYENLTKYYLRTTKKSEQLDFPLFRHSISLHK
jgi:vancomycin permeability regulator SanA